MKSKIYQLMFVLFLIPTVVALIFADRTPNMLLILILTVANVFGIMFTCYGSTSVDSVFKRSSLYFACILTTVVCLTCFKIEYVFRYSIDFLLTYIGFLLFAAIYLKVRGMREK